MVSHVLCLSLGSCQNSRHYWTLGSTEKRPLFADVPITSCYKWPHTFKQQCTLISCVSEGWQSPGGWFLLRSSHGIAVRCWLGLEPWDKILTHISGSWAKMAGKMGAGQTFHMVILGYLTAWQSQSSWTSQVTCIPRGSPKTCIPRGLGKSFRLLLI